ncbi:hypothetical protein KC721_01795 [Candidatus Woesebacteria bacterium]|nr:hypothetical protein [Candidatus Woesebacteria bacterium]
MSNNENRVPIENFKKNLDEVFKILNKHKIKDIIFIGLTPVADELLNPMPWKPTHGYSNENVQKYDAVLKQTAQENNSTYIELYEKFMNSDNYKKLLSDGLHPNTEGHELVYNLILSKLNLLSLLD